MIEILESRCFLDGTPLGTTTTLDFTPTMLVGNGSVTATATVRTTDGNPVTSGTVAFFWLDSGVSFSLLRDPVTGQLQGAETPQLVPVDSNGKAEFVSSYGAGKYDIAAVYLGAEPAYTDGADQTVQANSQTHLTTQFPFASTASFLIYTNGLAFEIAQGDIQFLDTIPPGATTVDSSGLTITQEHGGSPPFNTGPDDPNFTPPVDIAPNVMPLRVNVAFSYGFDSAANEDVTKYHYAIQPIDANNLPSVPEQNPAYHTSIARGEIHVLRPSSMLVSTAWSPTPTNTIIRATFFDDQGRPFTNVPDPATVNTGSFNSASTDVTVQTIGPSGGGATSSGGTLTLGGSGSNRAAGPSPTGTVSFYEGDQLLGVADVDDYANAVFRPPAGALSPGEHEIRAEYSGDDLDTPFTQTLDITVTRTPTFLSVNPATLTIAAGDQFTLSAKVGTSVPDFVVPSGTVTFSEGDQVLFASDLGSGNTVQLNLPIGSHQIQVNYPGDLNCLPCSGTITINVVQPATSVKMFLVGAPTFTNPPAITVSLFDPTTGYPYSGLGSAVTAPGTIQHVGAKLNVTIPAPSSSAEFASAFTGAFDGGRDIGFFAPSTAPGIAPTGSVGIFDGNQLLTTLPLDSYGSAVWYPPSGTFSLGSHSFHAVYSGDALYSGGTSDAQNITVGHTPTKLKLPTVYYLPPGKSSLDFAIQTALPDNVTPTGTVTFTEKGKVLAVCTLGSTSSAVWKLPRGRHTVTATYSGDANCLGDTQTLSFQVTPVPTEIRLGLPADNMRAANPTSIMPMVSMDGGLGPPTGMLHAWLDGRQIKAVHVEDLLNFGPKLRNGVHQVNVRYVGTSQVHASGSGTYTMRVQNGVIVSLDPPVSSSGF